MTLDTEVALEHYGVKGMKWGRRRTHQPDSDKPAGRSKIKTVAKVAGTLGAVLAAQAAGRYVGLKLGDLLDDLEDDKIVKGRNWLTKAMTKAMADPRW